MIIYRLTDRIPVDIGEVRFWVSPLSYEQKSQISSCVDMQAGEQEQDRLKMAQLTLKYSVKEVDGLKDSSGDDYTLTLDESGVLTDDCVSELFQMANVSTLITVTANLLNEIKEFDIPGAKICLDQTKSVKKK